MPVDRSAAPRNITTDNPARDNAPKYSPDGRLLAFQRQVIRDFYADRTRLMLFDRRAGKVRSLTEDWDRSADGLVWSPDSDALFGSIDDAGTRRIYRFDVSGGAPRAVTREHSFSSLAIAGSGPVIVGLRQSFTEPPTLVSIIPRTGAATKLSDFNDAALADLTQGRVESVTYKGANGDDVQMWVVYPPNFTPDQEVAAVPAAARRPAQRRDRRLSVALERAGVRELGLRHGVAQLPRLERLRPGLDRLDHEGMGRPALPGHDQGGASGSPRSRGSTRIAWRRAAAASAAISPRRFSAGRIRSRRWSRTPPCTTATRSTRAMAARRRSATASTGKTWSASIATRRT